MKIVINGCYGGFSLSPVATKRWAELHGRECYFYWLGFGSHKAHTLINVEDIDQHSWRTWVAYDIPNVDEALPSQEDWHEKTMEERQESNRLWDARGIETRTEDRSDPLLVQVVEELGEAANGCAAKLRVVEIPDDVEYEIDEYDGVESIHEVHRSWA